MRRRLVPLGLVVLLLTAACASRASQVPDLGQGTTTTSGGTGVTTPTVPTSRPTVDLLDAGSAPREQLRFHPSGGCEQPVTITQEIGLQIAIGATPGASTDQSVQWGLTYRCTKVTSDEITTSARYDDAKVLKADLGTGSTLDSVLHGFVGHEVQVTYDHRGQVLRATSPSVTLPKAIQAVADQLLNNLGSVFTGLSAPFPEQAVGVGARWRITGDAEVGGLHAHQVVEVTLTKVDGDHVEGTTTQTISFLPGTVSVPGVPASAGTVKVVDGNVSGTGSVTWDLTHPVTFGHQTSDGSVHLSIDATGVHETLSEAQHLDMTIAPRTD